MAEENLYNPYKKYEPIFGAWYITKQIGHGAIGKVYEIERREPGATYKAALKVITVPEGPDDVQSTLANGVAREDLEDYYNSLIDKFSGEFRNLEKLKGSSYVVNYEDHMICKNEDGLGWDMLIKTELLTPLVLHAIDEPLTESDVLKLGVDICRALRFCGQYGIIHRDIKPENILIAPSGDYKLGDFGIAKVLEETQMSMSRKGTYKYMSPEVFHGMTSGQSSDIYSLGLVMYKYLNNGRDAFMPPFPEKIFFDDSEQAFSDRITGKAVPEPASGCGELKRVVLKACAFDPEDRYQTASEMLEDLERLRFSDEYQAYLDGLGDETLNVSRCHDKSASGHRNTSAYDKSALGHRHTGVYENSALGHRNTSVYDNSSLIHDHALDSGTNSFVANSQASNDSRPYTKSPYYRPFMVFSVIFIIGMLALGIYTSIPKAVTDITGIDQNITLYYDSSISPEYAIEPTWFKDETIHFASSDEDIFTVSETGKITAVRIGEAVLHMSALNYEEKVNVSIVPKVTEITGVEESYSLTTGGSVDIDPVRKPKKFADQPVKFKSADKSIADVSSDGVITAVKAGTTTVKVSSGGTSVKTKVTVTDPAPVYYYRSSSSSSKKSSSGSSGGSKKKSSSKSSSGYFDSGDDEYFGD